MFEAEATEAFGMRTKQGGVFYVAAEDSHGMRGRVKALKSAHGDAPDFKLVDGVSDLLTDGSPDLAALKSAVEERRPALIFVDTLAMAFPGLEENSAEGMGRVVAASQELTEWGAAVVLIHHDTKSESLTPRGHSVLNGALDVALHVKKDGEGVIRGKLTKNRNGSCDLDIAFRIATEDGGTDEDGDMITLPRCSEISGGDDLMPRLTPSEAGALGIMKTELRILQMVADDTLIIAGDPGVGKTTLARILVSLHIAQDWELHVVSDMEEAFKVANKGEKNLFSLTISSAKSVFHLITCEVWIRGCRHSFQGFKPTRI